MQSIRWRWMTGLAAGAVALAGLVGVGRASAAGTQVTVTYTCSFPEAGPQAVPITFTSGFPATLPVNGTGMASVEASLALSPQTVGQLLHDGVTEIGGDNAFITLDATGPDGTSPVSVSRTQPNQVWTQLPASGGLTMPDHGIADLPAFSTVGSVAIDAAAFDLALSSSPTGPPTGSASCTPPAGSAGTIATIQIGDALRYDATLTGSTRIRAAGASAALTGSIQLSGDAVSNAYTGWVTLNDTQVDLRLLGIIPVTADLSFGGNMAMQTANATTTGSAVSLDLPSVMIDVPKIMAFGSIPVGGGINCHTPFRPGVDMQLTLPAHPGPSPAPVTGGYTLPPLLDCGQLTPLINTFFAGAGNTIQGTLIQS